jgi:hypothetical protein
MVTVFNLTTVLAVYVKEHNFFLCLKIDGMDKVLIV